MTEPEPGTCRECARQVPTFRAKGTCLRHAKRHVNPATGLTCQAAFTPVLEDDPGWRG